MPCCRTSRVTDSSLTAPPPRKRSRTLGFVFGALLYFGFACLNPLASIALVAAPLGLLLLFQRPTAREAMLAILLLVYAGWIAATATGFGRFSGAWICLLAGAVAVTLGLRAQEARGKLVASGLIAVGIAAVAGVLLIATTSFSFGELFWLANRYYSMRARVFLEILTAQMTGVDGGAELLAAVETTLDQWVTMLTRLLPALILLQSTAALAAAWAMYRAMVRHPEGDPLPALRDFRFSDQMIWGIVTALVALVLPGKQVLHVIGGNLATFFGALYVVRGFAIVATLAAAAGVGGIFVTLLASFIVIVLGPIVMFGALALGVTDTWVDWRKLALKAKNG